MYDIKRLEAGQQLQQQHQQHQQHQQQQQQQQQPQLSERLSGLPQHSLPQLTCSIITTTPTTPPTPTPPCPITAIAAGGSSTHMTLLTLRRRRAFQRRACLLSILAAFVFGMALGVIVPMLGLPDYFSSRDQTIVATLQAGEGAGGEAEAPPLPYSVAFIREEAPAPTELSAEQVFRNAFHLEQDKLAPDSMIVKKLDTEDGSIKEFHVQRIGNGRYRKGPERRLSKSSSRSSQQSQPAAPADMPPGGGGGESELAGLLDSSSIYWGPLVEDALPPGFAVQQQRSWQHYVSSEGQVVRLEAGCGRMQNRLVVFADGTRACARYRQNTDQIQGEIFSYYLGQLLNISNLAPSAATVIDTSTSSWSKALGDITQAQWKEHRPVVLTRWLPELEPAGIPQPFQPLERHLNKLDIWNMTRELAKAAPPHQSSALEVQELSPSEPSKEPSTTPLLQRLIELAQWSDLIVFDYLIANLDRVVNNLYNFQWNADIMAAPAHNLARQSRSQLLVFLDNESGLLHGYRLLKKYEAYHSLLLDNLCIFRRPTIQALQRLRAGGEGAAGRQLRELFERTTSPYVRDVLPSLPDKSIKILEERIDRVLAQVHKCSDSSGNKSS